MNIFAIGDLHLGFESDKPMEVFGEKWHAHTAKLKAHWEETVKAEDVVIVCGDISWGMRLEDAYVDLEWLDRLPGKKVCIKGNHDYWWEKIGKLNTLFDSIYFLQNKAYMLGEVAICGTRGWQCPSGEAQEASMKIYEREAQRLKLSLEDARRSGATQYIVALHYPPTNEKQEASLFTEIIKDYAVGHLVYGHLHDEKAWQMALKGEREHTFFHLVAADYTQFYPVKIK